MFGFGGIASREDALSHVAAYAEDITARVHAKTCQEEEAKAISRELLERERRKYQAEVAAK